MVWQWYDIHLVTSHVRCPMSVPGAALGQGGRTDASTLRFCPQPCLARHTSTVGEMMGEWWVKWLLLLALCIHKNSQMIPSFELWLALADGCEFELVKGLLHRAALSGLALPQILACTNHLIVICCGLLWCVLCWWSSGIKCLFSARNV